MVATSLCLGRILRWVLLFFIHFAHKCAAQTTAFEFPVLTIRNLTLLGDAHLKNGTVSLSKELGVPTSSAGRALYSQPVRLLDPYTKISASFKTYFSFSVTNVGPGPDPVSIGDGLAFIIASDDTTVGGPGGFLGVMSPVTGFGDALQENQNTIAVEFDTQLDVQFNDPNGNHVGLDINNMTSVQVADLGTIDVDIKSGNIITAWIEYDSTEKILSVSMSYSSEKPLEPVLSVRIDLSQYLNEFMFVGFSASTGGSTELHNIERWSFSSFGPPSSNKNPSVSPVHPPAGYSAPLDTDQKSPLSPIPVLGRKGGCHSHVCMSGGMVVGLATGGAFVIALFAGSTAWFCLSKHRRLKRSDSFSSDIVKLKLPRKFTYKELSTATKGFQTTRIVGHGAFGTVYKGILPDNGALVAVKRSTNNTQGKSEFLSELSIIGCLRHRNLVQLQGWCYEKGEVLLVYDYMSNSSLDKVLFQEGGEGFVLSWRHRCNIVMGVASALAYLHEEWEKQIVHRDVKASNIMLDGSFNARLGDFGLARLTEHNKSPDATLTAGTMGYLAPEYILSGKASEKTDVFSFGAVVLEVACGRRPIEKDVGPRGSNLVDWVWGLHRDGQILEVADVRLEGNFDVKEMTRMLLVGLLCSHPDPVTRPTMRQVLQILSGEAPVPHVPRSKPSISFPSNLLLNLQDIVSDCDQSELSSCSTSFKDQYSR
ncbi:hypothetical protein KI387_033474 [Taxus chinensis]|uniref:non-specific serine/threonine protein kinase n=1 Tax=Taxus chinensis TaxID=29808 RepID=A0AA38C3N3_TAXCH|nr:hypothetical protein KI387_033474 [Taxus chinensis]